MANDVTGTASIAGVGSNLSLASCVNQDQELSRGSNSFIVAVGQHVQGRNSSGDSQRGCTHHQNLQLIPVNTASCPPTSLDTSKGKHHNQRRSRAMSSRHCERKHRAELISTVSTLYAKLLVVVGVTVPVTASIGQPVPASPDQVGLYIPLVGLSLTINYYRINGTWKRGWYAFPWTKPHWHYDTLC